MSPGLEVALARLRRSRDSGPHDAAALRLSFAGLDLDPTDGAELSAALLADPSAACALIDASNNLLGVAGVVALSRALPSLPRLASLVLSDNVLVGRFLSDKGQRYEGEAADTAALPALLGAAHLCSALRSLDLSHNHLGVEGAAALARGLAACDLPNLSLTLGFCKLTPGAAAEVVAALRRPVPPAWLAWAAQRAQPADRPPPAAPRPALGGLSLRNNTLLVAGAEAVAAALGCGPDSACLAVASLSLLNNHIAAGGAAALSAALLGCNPFLESLDVSSNCLGSEGVACLASALASPTCAPRLVALDAHRNNAGDAGAAALAAALGGARLVRLRLSSNHVHSPGAAALAAALAGRPALVDVDLRRNHFGAEDEKALRAACPTALLGHGPI